MTGTPYFQQRTQYQMTDLSTGIIPYALHLEGKNGWMYFAEDRFRMHKR